MSTALTTETTTRVRPEREPGGRPAFSANMQFGGKTASGKDLPHFKGSIRAPDTDITENLALWTGTYTGKDGNALVFFTGTTGFREGLSAMEQIHARAAPKAKPIQIGGKDGNKPMELEDGRVVMFEAKHPDGSLAANGNRRTDVYGYWNNHGSLVEIGAYANAQDGRLASLVGNTQYPLNRDKLHEPSREEKSQKDIDEMLARSGPDDGIEPPAPERPRKRYRAPDMER